MEIKNQEGVSRRSFLKTTGLASGGLLIGFNLFTACEQDIKPIEDLALLDYKDFNAYIKISSEGKVTIFAPNPEIGQGVKTSMPMLIAEELDVLWEDVYVVQGDMDRENFTNQFAGGSNSLKLSWLPLRETGATAKQMLINAAALQWGVSSNDCYAKEGRVYNQGGESLGYGDLVDAASKLEIPENFKLKDPKDFTIIGKGKSNVDIDKIVTGLPLFGLDTKVEGMVYATVLRPPAFGQKLESYDDEGARAVNGVIDIIRFEDKIGVLAKNTWSAIQGKKALEANWIVDSEGESSADHDQLMFDMLDKDDLNVMREDGDVKSAFGVADHIIEHVYESPFMPHNCMEPMNFFANVTAEKVQLIGPIQTPQGTAAHIAETLGRDFNTVSLEMTRMGGGFGRRLYGDFAVDAATLSNLSKRPVQLIYTREDDMTAGIYRPAVKYKLSAAIKDGELTGYHVKEAAINDNMYGLIPNFFPAGAIENYKVEVDGYASNITSGAWRAPSTNFHAVAEQSFFDEIAEYLKIDPIQFKLKLLQNAKGSTDERMLYSPERLEGVIQLVKEKSSWGRVGEGTFQGFASYFCHDTHVAEVADVIIKDGKPVVTKVTCAVDCGIVVNPLGAINQVKGGIIDGIGHAFYGGISFKDGRPMSDNFHQYQLIRMKDTPEIDVHFVENQIAPTGLGEPSLPPAGAAVANAIYAATGKRLRKIPFMAGFENNQA